MITDSVTQELLEKQSPEIRPLAEALRRLVREAAPQAEEKGIKGWGVIAYSREGLFCGIQPQRNWVNLIFYRGVELPDPQGILEGTGKGMRHVKVGELGDIRVNALKALVREAFKLGGVKGRR